MKDLADRLNALRSEADQQELLSRNINLVNSTLAFALIDLARQDRTRGELKQSLAAAQLALGIAERSHAAPAQARALMSIGFAHYDQGEILQAMDWYRKSLTVSEAIHDELASAQALNVIGIAYHDQGELSLAEEYCRKSLALGEKLHDERTILRATGNLGIIHTAGGDYVQAFSFFQRTAELTEHSGDPGVRAKLFINIGAVFERQGDYDEAAAYAQRALDLAEPAGNRLETAAALLNLGTENEFRGDLAGALADYEKSLKISQAIGAKNQAAANLTHMGSAHLARKEYAAAIELYQRSLRVQEEIGIKAAMAETFVDLASVYNLQGDFQQGLQWASRALEASGSEGFIQPVWRAHLQAGRSQRGLNRFGPAETEFGRAISVIEDMRSRVAGDESEQAGFLGDRMEPYSGMVELLIAADRPADAFEYAERAKARVLVDVLRSGRSQLDSVLTDEESRHDRQLRSRLSELNTQVRQEARVQKKDSGMRTPLKSELEDTRLQYAAFQTSLYARHPEMKTERGEMEPIRSEEAQRLIGADTAFLEFVVADDNLFLFVSAGGAGPSGSSVTVQVFEQEIQERKLAEMIDQFRRQLAERDLGFRSTAKRLYQLVMAPASSYFKGKTKLLIVPDGVLWELPFQALLDSAGRYLLDDYAVSYAPSLTAWKSMIEMKKQRQHNPQHTQLLAMGNPAWDRGAVEHLKAIYRDEDLGALPLAEVEVRRLGKIYGENQSRVYTGTEARESRFKAEAGTSRVIHLATHAILNNASPLYSYLLLAGDSSAEDGILEARELLRMKLNAELAVLSACETARGRVGAGEGMIGLSWALLVSGVPTTVLSQWKVESDSTSRLMVAFHQARRKGISDAAALRVAALTLRRNPSYRHPFYWAPFIVMGAGLD